MYKAAGVRKVKNWIEFGFLLKEVTMNWMQVKVNQLLNWENAIN